MANFEEYKNVWVFAEQRQGKLMNVALELVGEGQVIQRDQRRNESLRGAGRRSG